MTLQEYGVLAEGEVDEKEHEMRIETVASRFSGDVQAYVCILKKQFCFWRWGLLHLSFVCE